MRMPDFNNAGAQKSGTTWLSIHLSRHPQIHMPVKQNFFYQDLPLVHYAEQFRDTPAGKRCSDDLTSERGRPDF
jgi:hypothetical protein